MSYNYAKEFNEWKKWKNHEEELLKTLGVDKHTIQQLHDYDWEILKAERRFRRNQSVTLDTFFLNIPDHDKKEIISIDDLLSEIEDEALFAYLSTIEQKSLTIILLKIFGYTTREISEILNISCASIYKKIQRLRTDLRKI